MWLPAIPTKTECILQSPINSASSIARCIELTVASIFTTTPFFNPEDGCNPAPIISKVPSGLTTPTIAATFEVPISNPTIICSSFVLAIFDLI